METLKPFLSSVYPSIRKRGDSYLELGLALASASQVESVVSLSERPLYCRRFSRVYETLGKVEWDEAAFLKASLELLAARCHSHEGVEVYSGDSSFIKRSEAKTLEARVMKRLSSGALVHGHGTYWTMRLSPQTNSWAGVVSVERMAIDASVSAMAAKHMSVLDGHGETAKLLVLEAGHGQDVLAGYRACKQTAIVMRLKSHQVFYHQPDAYRGRGRPPLHGKRFKLNEAAEPETQTTTLFKGKRLGISSWRNLHDAHYSDIHGVVLRLEFLDEQGQNLFENPIWLLSTALHLKPETLAKAYLWRSSQELSFRFMKQHLGLNKLQSPELKCCDAWYRLVALAMNLLLALRDQLKARPPAWYPQAASRPISQRLAQKQALAFFLGVDSPCSAPQPAGNALGRAKGYHPPPSIRHPVTRKTPKRIKACPSCPFKQAT